MMYAGQDGRPAPSPYATPPPAYPPTPGSYQQPYPQAPPQQHYAPLQSGYPPQGGHPPQYYPPTPQQQPAYPPQAPPGQYFPPQTPPNYYVAARGAQGLHRPTPSPHPSPHPAPQPYPVQPVQRQPAPPPPQQPMHPPQQPILPLQHRHPQQPYNPGYQPGPYSREAATPPAQFPGYAAPHPAHPIRPSASPSPNPHRQTAADEAFTRADTTGKGALDIANFERALSLMGVHSLPYAQMIKVFYLSDTDRNGEISRPEFVRVAPQLLAGAAFARARIRAGTSTLDLVGLENALRILGFNLSNGRVLAYYQAGDANRDFRIDFDEFWSLLSRVRADYRLSVDDMLRAFRDRVDAEGAAAPGRGPLRVSSEQADAAFARADHHRRGKLQVGGFARALHELGFTVGTGRGMMEHFVRADRDRDGHISRNEFLDIFRPR